MCFTCGGEPCFLICDVIIVLRGLQMSGLVCWPILVNYNNSARERRKGSQSLPFLLCLALTLSIEYLATVSCKKQADLDTQDVTITISPSITKTLVVSSLFLQLKSV